MPNLTHTLMLQKFDFIWTSCTATELLLNFVQYLTCYETDVIVHQIGRFCFLPRIKGVRAHEGRKICWDLPIPKFCFELLPLCV